MRILICLTFSTIWMSGCTVFSEALTPHVDLTSPAAGDCACVDDAEEINTPGEIELIIEAGRA